MSFSVHTAVPEVHRSSAPILALKSPIYHFLIRIILRRWQDFKKLQSELSNFIVC